MAKIFGGGTSKASERSVENQRRANEATQRFIEQQTGLARSDVLRLFPQGDVARNLGIQGALDIIGRGVSPQISAFQQGNVGAQNILGQGLSGFQNAILGLPVQQFTPQTIDIDPSFLQGVSVPDFLGATEPAAPAVQPVTAGGGNFGFSGGRSLRGGALDALAGTSRRIF